MEFAQSIRELSIAFVPFFMAVIFHEYAHGLVAYWFGDKTAYHAGRLTLNPVVHMDLIGTVALPILSTLLHFNLFFGWAKPVPVDPNRFKNYRKGVFFVAAAGPAMNCLLAFLSAFGHVFLTNKVATTFFFYEPLYHMSYASVFMNYSLAIFNLIPLPPLDGSRMLAVLLPPKLEEAYNALSQYSFMILFLMISGFFSILLGPIRFCSHFTFWIVSLLF
jgi:Zn-dependent protease